MEEEFEDTLERDELENDEEESSRTEDFDPKAERVRIYQELQAKFDEDRDRLLGAARQDERRQMAQRLKDTAGIEWTAEDDFRAVDPMRATQFVARGQQPQADPLDLPIDFYADDAETIQAKNARQIQRGVEAALKPIQDQMAALQGMAMQPAMAGAPAIAKAALDQRGLGAYAEHPDFEKTVIEAINFAVQRKMIPAGSVNDPATVRGIVGMMLMEDQLPKPVETPRERDPGTGRFAPPNPSRAALSSTRPSSGSGQPPRTAVMDDEDKVIWDTCNEGGNGFKSQAEYEAFARSKREGDPEIYTSYLEQSRRKAAAGGRR